jgi:beta-lactam-binding protein with PASTA domain
MPLVKPSLAPVSAGQPVTAQAWNAILTAIGALYDAVLALGTHTVDISVQDASGSLIGATVVAVPAAGAPVQAVAPRGGGTAYTLTGLAPGPWTVHVSAPGYTATSIAVTVPVASAPPPVTLTRTTVAMPDLLGKAIGAAVGVLTGAGIQVDQILDVSGDELSKNALPADKANSKVLFQFPLPGAQVTAASAKTRLVVSAENEVATTVVPSFVGMNYAQLIKALNAAGLKLGTIKYLTK